MATAATATMSNGKIAVKIPAPRYRCEQEVVAIKIGKIEILAPASARGSAGVRITPVDKSFEPIVVSMNYYVKHRPEVGGYWLTFENGCQCWSSAEAFEAGFTKI
jgi:hypothetical protein